MGRGTELGARMDILDLNRRVFRGRSKQACITTYLLSHSRKIDASNNRYISFH